MASAATATEERWVHLHIPLDMSNEGERRLGELFEALPNGMKTNFCKSLLVESVPIEDVDLDLLLAKFIREMKGRGKQRGRPRIHEKKPVAAASAPAPVAAPVAPAPAGATQEAPEEGEKIPTGNVNPPVAGGFENLAGGKSW